MAMQTSLGASKLVFLAGAGIAGSVLFKNSKLGEFIRDVTEVVSKHGKESEDVLGEGSESALSLQVQRLSQEFRSLASSSMTVIHGGSGSGVSITTLILPAVVVGAVSYGCMKWRGYSFSDLMFVSKKGLSDAVASMGNQLELVSGALSATRKNMNQRLDNVNGKLDHSTAITGLIADQVEEVKGVVGKTIYKIENVNTKIEGLELKIDEVHESQSFANQGIFLLISWAYHLNAVGPKKYPELVESLKSWYLKASSMEKTSSFLTSPDLKQLFSEALEPNNLLETTPVRNTGEDPNEYPELTESLESWNLKASSMEKTSSFVTSPDLKQPFSEALEPDNHLKTTPVRYTGESGPPGLSLGLGLLSNLSTGMSAPRTLSASIVSRSTLAR